MLFLCARLLLVEVGLHNALIVPEFEGQQEVIAVFVVHFELHLVLLLVLRLIVEKP